MRQTPHVEPALAAGDGDESHLASLARAARKLIIQSVAHAGAGHIGGPLSAVDALCALFWHGLKIRPDQPDWPDRDRFILSKGHSSIALYTVMALRGYFPVAELDTFDAVDSRLQGHPDMTKLPGLDMSTGSLGLGLSAAVGIALGARLGGRDFRTYVMVGDGECNEGIVWEAAEAAQRHRLDNLIVIVDHNNLQQTGFVDPESGSRLAPYGGDQLAQRWAAFGWRVLVVDGHDLPALTTVLDRARSRSGSPTVIISHSVKGKGVSFMEDVPGWHSRVPTADELRDAVEELDHANRT